MLFNTLSRFDIAVLPMSFLDFLDGLMAQTVKHLPTMRETQVQTLDQEDPLEKEMATHSCLEKSHGQRSLVGYNPWGHKESDMT